MRLAFRDKLGSISHRSGQFKDIYSETVNNIRQIFLLPDEYEVVFTSSATEIWERIIQNLVETKSVHLVNGAFSNRFYKTALDYQKSATQFKVEDGKAVRPAEVDPLDSPELLAITHNETSTGVSQPIEDLEAFRSIFPDALIAVDAVSSVPYPSFDWSLIDTLYFSVQKCFGLPAGLGVWLVNNKTIAKAELLQDKGLITGSYHRLTDLVKKTRTNQTPETPNVVGIYLLGKIIQDMLEKGLDQIRRETDYKAAVLNHTFSELSWADLFVEDSELRSKTVIVAKTDIESSRIINYLEGKGMIIGAGYGSHKSSHIRIANFPTHSKEQMERLSDLLLEYKG